MARYGLALGPIWSERTRMVAHYGFTIGSVWSERN